MKILISGLGGFMGRELANLCRKGIRGAELIGGIDINGCTDAGVPCSAEFGSAVPGADVIIDFSHHAATQALTDYAVSGGIPLVIATTGQTEDELAMIAAASEKIPVFFASNYSMGIAILCELAKRTAALMPDAEIEIIEKHHNRKLDAPSGTAMTLAKEMASVRENAEIRCGRSGYGKREKNEIGIQSVRMGNIVGEHEVIIGTDNQTITLKHEAHSRALFAEGALAAAEFIIGRECGLYDMKSLVKF